MDTARNHGRQPATGAEDLPSQEDEYDAVVASLRSLHVAQAALAHAQFETIHPFVDGNGRTGRALIHFVLRRRGLAQRISPPVSLVLATWAHDYIGGLTASRYRGKANS